MADKEYNPQSDDSRTFSGHDTEQLEIEHPVKTSRLNESPLYFTLRINGSYYISFKDGDGWSILAKGAAWALINVLINYVVQTYLDVGDFLKSMVYYGLIGQIVLFFVLSYLDAGTIFEDEEDEYNEDRTFCTNCKIYKKRSSKHCIWCNKCTMWYDHHCSVFGKCIGKRNIVPFFLLITFVGTEMPFLIILFVVHIANQV